MSVNETLKNIEQKVEEVVTEVANAEKQEVQELYVLDKVHLQSFLNYLATKPYQEVFQLVEAMKTARLFQPTSQPAQSEV